MNQEKYFFCYSTNLMGFLRYECGYSFVCTGFHDKTKKKFWLFERSELLAIALIEYNKRGKDLGLRSK